MLGMKRSELLRLIVVGSINLALIGSLLAAFLDGCWRNLRWSRLERPWAIFFPSSTWGRGFSLWRELGLSLASGLAVALLAALHPAVEAIRMSPLESARQTAWSPSFRGKTPGPPVSVSSVWLFLPCSFSCRFLVPGPCNSSASGIANADLLGGPCVSLPPHR